MNSFYVENLLEKIRIRIESAKKEGEYRGGKDMEARKKDYQIRSSPNIHLFAENKLNDKVGPYRYSKSFSSHSIPD